MLSMHDDERYLFEALKAGAVGYVLKHEADQALVDAVHAVGRGEPFLTNAAQRSLVRAWMADDSAGPREPLSPREQEVLKLDRRGPHEPRDRRGPAPRPRRPSSPTARNLLRKLGMRDRVELVRYAIRRGLDRALAAARPAARGPTIWRGARPGPPRPRWPPRRLALLAARAGRRLRRAAATRARRPVGRLAAAGRHPAAGLPPARPGRPRGLAARAARAGSSS